MNWAWQVGMIILSGVPAIIGGGLFWSIFENWTAVIIWEIILLFGLGFVLSKRDTHGDAHAH